MPPTPRKKKKVEKSPTPPPIVTTPPLRRSSPRRKPASSATTATPTSGKTDQSSARPRRRSRPSNRINWASIVKRFNSIPGTPPSSPSRRQRPDSSGEREESVSPTRRSSPRRKSVSTPSPSSPSKSPQRNRTRSPSLSPTDTIPLPSKKKKKKTNNNKAGTSTSHENNSPQPAAAAAVEQPEISLSPNPRPAPGSGGNRISASRASLSSSSLSSSSPIANLPIIRLSEEEEEEEVRRLEEGRFNEEEGEEAERLQELLERPPEIPPTTDPISIDYAFWITSNWFVPAEERPKVKKTRGTDYKYETLLSLDNQMRNLAYEQFKKGQKPLLGLKEWRFVYGVVISIVPQRFRQENEHRIYISDETMESVLVRICASPSVAEKGPEIQVGDVIRIHRVAVQLEHNSARDQKEMVLSTTPHWNYVVFRLTRDAIVYNTLAHSITFNDDKDIPRIHELLDFSNQIRNPPPPATRRNGDGDEGMNGQEEGENDDSMMSTSWDGNTTATTLAIQKEGGQRNSITTPNRVASSSTPSPRTSTPLRRPPQSPMVTPTSIGSNTSSIASGSPKSILKNSPFRSETGTRMNRGGSDGRSIVGGTKVNNNNKRRQNLTYPRFHQTPPPYRT